MSVKNCKAKGTKAEHRSMRLLEKDGYRCTRAAASLGEWDIIGIGRTDVVLVQVKCSRWPGSKETATLQNFHVPPGVRRLLHRWMPYKREPDVKELTNGEEQQAVA